jgi:hypothetical protein
MQRTDAASKMQMLAYLLTGILCMLGKMHGKYILIFDV